MKIKEGDKTRELKDHEKQHAITVFAVAYVVTTLILSYLAR